MSYRDDMIIELKVKHERIRKLKEDRTVMEEDITKISIEQATLERDCDDLINELAASLKSM